MKRIFTILLILLSTIIFAQDYKLFNSESKKLFSTYPEMTNTYSLSFDLATTVGSDSVYYNFFKIEDWNFVSYECDFWIGPDCYKQNVPVWAGAKIEYDNQYVYNFYPDNENTILFNFLPNVGNTNTFYIDDEQKFSLTYEYTDTITILNYADSARYFTISHTDLEGNVINSQLHEQNIIIAKNLGLIQFFQIDEFPQALNPVYLIGQENPNLGIFNITNEMLYDFQPGDEFQYEEYYFTTNGPPWWTYNCYRKHTILDRIETNDSLIYIIDELFFYEDSSFIITNTITKEYNKHQIIAQIPFEKFEGDYQWFYLDDYCEFNLWTYSFEAENSLEYCEIDDVWGYYDTNGPPSDDETIEVLGLGMYYDKHISYSGSIQYASGYTKEMIYFKKDDVVCGELIVSTSIIKDNNDNILVYPNPAKEYIQIKSSSFSSAYNIEIRSLYGQLVKEEKNILSQHYSLNVADLKPGIYFYIIKENEVVVQQGKLIKN